MGKPDFLMHTQMTNYIKFSNVNWANNICSRLDSQGPQFYSGIFVSSLVFQLLALTGSFKLYDLKKIALVFAALEYYFVAIFLKDRCLFERSIIQHLEYTQLFFRIVFTIVWAIDWKLLWIAWIFLMPELPLSPLSYWLY